MKEFKFIPQPYKSMQCGQTCLAMITGKTIDEICDELGKKWTTYVQSDIQNYLDRNGYKTRLIQGKNISFDEVPNNSIIRVCFPSENGHVVVKHENKYYDPAVGIIDQMLAYVEITHYLTFEKKEHKKTTH